MSNSIEWYAPNGDIIQFTTGRAATYRLQALEGLAPVSLSPISIKSPSQPGETALDMNVPPRVVVVQGILQANSQADLWPVRRALSRACATQPTRYNETLELGRLRILRDEEDPLELDCRVLSAKFPNGPGNVGITAFDIEFYAPNPYWRELEDETTTMSGSGGFEFPLEFTEEFVGGSVTQEITNAGDVDAPVVARIYGACTNPRIINETTDETIEIIGSFLATEYIEINTGFGTKTIELVVIATGVRTNIFSQLNPDSDLWALTPGTNIVSFEADVLTTGYATLAWRERYAGV
jgi:phage-related protein